MDRKKLVDQSIDYMMQHLEDDLSLDRIAAQFYVSKFHFCRIFKAETGESLYSFLKRSRIDQSAIDMKLNPAKPITEVGLDYGYSASNYSSVFRTRHHTSPSVFRQTVPARSMPVPFSPARVVHFKTAQEYDARIGIQTLPDFFVRYARFIGSYADIEPNWYRFLDRCQAFVTAETLLIERFFHDPAITDAAQCICDLCISAPPNPGLPDGMWIRGGKSAVYHFDGAIQDIYEALQGIFTIWLPQSGYRMTQRYGLNVYRRIDRENHRVAMDLCIPIA